MSSDNTKTILALLLATIFSALIFFAATAVVHGYGSPQILAPGDHLRLPSYSEQL